MVVLDILENNNKLHLCNTLRMTQGHFRHKFNQTKTKLGVTEAIITSTANAQT